MLLTSTAIPVTAAVASAASASSLSKQRSELLGQWTAKGTVTAAHHSATQLRGEVLARRWLIRNACTSKQCALEFTLQTAGPTANTLGTPVGARLVPQSTTWHASVVEPRVQCLNTTPGYPDVSGTERSSWKVTVKSSQVLVAAETTKTTGRDCRTATSTIRWTARRLSATIAG